MNERGQAARRPARLSERHDIKRNPHRCGFGWWWIDHTHDPKREQAARRLAVVRLGARGRATS